MAREVGSPPTAPSQARGRIVEVKLEATVGVKWRGEMMKEPPMPKLLLPVKKAPPPPLLLLPPPSPPRPPRPPPPGEVGEEVGG